MMTCIWTWTNVVIVFIIFSAIVVIGCLLGSVISEPPPHKVVVVQVLSCPQCPHCQKNK